MSETAAAAGTGPLAGLKVIEICNTIRICIRAATKIHKSRCIRTTIVFISNSIIIFVWTTFQSWYTCNIRTFILIICNAVFIAIKRATIIFVYFYSGRSIWTFIMTI